MGWGADNLAALAHMCVSELDPVLESACVLQLQQLCSVHFLSSSLGPSGWPGHAFLMRTAEAQVGGA